VVGGRASGQNYFRAPVGVLPLTTAYVCCGVTLVGTSEPVSKAVNDVKIRRFMRYLSFFALSGLRHYWLGDVKGISSCFSLYRRAIASVPILPSLPTSIIYVETNFVTVHIIVIVRVHDRFYYQDFIAF